jgi:hypothetical protein
MSRLKTGYRLMNVTAPDTARFAIVSFQVSLSMTTTELL